MTDRNELISDIVKLKAERDRLLEQIKEAEQWESAAWDSFNAVADHVNALEKKQKIAKNYWIAHKEIFNINLILWQIKQIK